MSAGSAAPSPNHALTSPTDNSPASHSHHSPAGQDTNTNAPAFTKPPEGCTDYEAQTSCPFSLPIYTWWCRRPFLELDISCGFIFHERTSLLTAGLQSLCLPADALWSGTCLPLCGNLVYQESFESCSSCTLAKLLFGRRNSSLLAGCHRLRKAVPSWCSSCFSSPLLGVSPCPTSQSASIPCCFASGAVAPGLQDQHS